MLFGKPSQVTSKNLNVLKLIACMIKNMFATVVYLNQLLAFESIVADPRTL